MAHWYVIGASPDRLNEIRGLDHMIDPIEGPVDAEGQSHLFRKLSLAAPDGLWIRWEALESPEWAGLRRLRVAQPVLPIIIEIPSDWAPPNEDLAQLVGLGIYGIVSESSSFASATSRNFSYADAAHWQGRSGLTWEEADAEVEAKPKTTIEFRTVEKIVEKKIAASSRPVLIAVVGVAPGVGVTTTSVEVSRTLAAMGYDVALVESSNAPPALSRWESELPSGITVFASPSPDPLELVRRREWPYIIVDGGAIQGWSEITPWQADLTVMVGPGDRHRFSRWEQLVRSIPTEYTGAIVGGAVIGRDSAAVVEGLETDGNLPAAFAFSSNAKKSDKAMKALLAPVIGEGKGRRWWRKSYVPSVVEAPTKPTKKDPEWRYTPSDSSSPPASPYAPPPTNINVQVGRGKRSGIGRVFTWIVDAAILWGIASVIAWFLVLASTSGSGIPINPGRWFAWAQWIVSVNGRLLNLL